MITTLEFLFLIAEVVALLVNALKSVSVIFEHVKNGVSTWEDIINETLKLINVDLADLHSALLKLLNQVPMKEGEAHINNISIEFARIIVVWL